MLKWIASLLLGLGAVAWLSSKASAAILTPGRGPLGPMIWRESLLTGDWPATLRSFGFVTVRLMTGTRDDGDATGAPSIIAAARAAGAAVQGWGWHYLRDADAAQAEGIAAAQGAKRYGARVYVVNAEKHAWGGEGEPRPADPPGNFAAFAAAFRAHAPGILLSYGGYSANQIGADAADAVVGLFDIWGPMLYGTRRATIAKKWRAEHARARLAGAMFGPIVGSGRISDDFQVWGFAYGAGTDPGLLDLQAEAPADLIQPFIGSGGASSMLLRGNLENPPITELARALRGEAATV